MPEAISALLRNGFASAGILHRVVAHCNPENPASWRLLGKMEFRREGLLKKEALFRKDADGRPLWTDTLVLSCNNIRYALYFPYGESK